jgi:hypothetical protein
MVIDRQGWLWVIDPANHGFGRPRIVAIDIDSGFVVHEHVFPRAPRRAALSCRTCRSIRRAGSSTSPMPASGAARPR